MYQIGKFRITDDEWKETIELLKNTYFPVYDHNNKIVELSNVPPSNVIIETVEEIRRKKAL